MLELELNEVDTTRRTPWWGHMGPLPALGTLYRENLHDLKPLERWSHKQPGAWPLPLEDPLKQGCTWSALTIPYTKFLNTGSKLIPCLITFQNQLSPELLPPLQMLQDPCISFKIVSFWLVCLIESWQMNLVIHTFRWTLGADKVRASVLSRH